MRLSTCRIRVILPATTIPTTHPRRSLWLKIPLVVLGSFSRYGSEFPLLWLKNPPAVGTWPKAGAAFPILPRGAAETFAARLAPHVGGGPMAGQALGRFALQRLGQDTQDTQDTQDYACLVRMLASLSLARKPFLGPQAFHWRVSLPCHRPGCLGCPECLGQPVKNEIPSGRPAYPQWHSLWNSTTDWERRHLGGAC